ncbi:MAG: hypothetical protein WC728_11930 [Elusimicrobiota bacterium]
MSRATADKAVSVYLFGKPKISRIRFFGGEPLLRFRLLKHVVESNPGTAFSFPTNGTLLDGRVQAFLREHPAIEVMTSRVPGQKLPNLLVSVTIEPPRAADVAKRTAMLLKRGLNRLNFLPAFFVRWSRAELGELSRSLGVTAGLLRAWRERGKPLEVRNLSTRNPVPLFNHGMVVDVNGDVFSSNAALCVPFQGLRRTLLLGNLSRSEKIDWAKASAFDWDGIFRESLDPRVYRDTMAVNDILTDFVERLAA